MRSIASGHPAELRPTYEQSFNNVTGEITVTIPKQHLKVKQVKLSYGETLQNERRDFRWVVKSGEQRNCTSPYLPLPSFMRSTLEKRYPFMKEPGWRDDDDNDVCL